MLLHMLRAVGAAAAATAEKPEPRWSLDQLQDGCWRRVIQMRQAVSDDQQQQQQPMPPMQYSSAVGRRLSALVGPASEGRVGAWRDSADSAGMSAHASSARVSASFAGDGSPLGELQAQASPLAGSDAHGFPMIGTPGKSNRQESHYR